MLAKDDAASDSKSQAIQMIVLKKIGRGGVINLGGVIRNEGSKYSVIVESTWASLLEIDGKRWMSLLDNANFNF